MGEKKKANEKIDKGGKKNVNLLSANVFLLYNGLVRWLNQLEYITMSDYQHVRSSGHFAVYVFIILTGGGVA